MSDLTVPSVEFHLNTTRLLIQRLLPTRQHAQFIHKLYNTPLFLAGQGKTGIDTEDKAMGMINGFASSTYERNGHGFYIMTLREGTMIGTVTLIRGEYRCPDVGFALLPEYTGNGYAQEAGKAMIDYATRPKSEGGLGYPGVFGLTSANNAKSMKVCESVGLEYRGVYPLQAFGAGRSAVYTLPGMSEDLEEYGIKETKMG